MVSRCPYLQHLALLSFKFLRQHVSHLNLHHLASFYFTFYVSVSPLLFLSFIVFLSLLVSILTLSSSLLFQVFLSICPFLHRSALFYFQVFTSMCPSLHHLLLSLSLCPSLHSLSLFYFMCLCVHFAPFVFTLFKSFPLFIPSVLQSEFPFLLSRNWSRLISICLIANPCRNFKTIVTPGSNWKARGALWMEQ